MNVFTFIKMFKTGDNIKNMNETNKACHAFNVTMCRSTSDHMTSLCSDESTFH